MKIIITAHNFDGYQITKVSNITNEELDKIRPVIEAIKTFGKEGHKESGTLKNYNFPVSGMYNVKEAIDKNCKDYYEIYVELLGLDGLLVDQFEEDYVPGDVLGISDIMRVELVETIETLI